MAAIIGCSSSPFPHFQLNTNPKLRLSHFVNKQSVAHLTISDQDKSYGHILGVPKLRARLQKPQTALVVGSEDHSQISCLQRAPKDIFPIGNSCFHISGKNGRKPVASFCNRPFNRDNEVISSNSKRTRISMSSFMVPYVLVASFLYPQHVLPEVISKICGNSSLTIFLLLFFTEAIFYCGVAVFLLLLDRLMRPKQLDPSANNSNTLSLQLEQRISFDTALVVPRLVSVAIPMLTMGLTWPWTGPLVPATLVPYLVGIVVQFKYEQNARYWNSPSWVAIPFIFHAYRLHQIHRAAKFLTVMLFEAKMGYSKLPVASGSLSTISNVIHLLIVIWIWSFSSFLMRFLTSASASTTKQ